MNDTTHTRTPVARADTDTPTSPPDGMLPASLNNEDGMSTIEYAMGSIAAAALAAVLYTVITGGDVVDAIRGIILDALNSGPGA